LIVNFFRLMYKSHLGIDLTVWIKSDLSINYIYKSCVFFLVCSIQSKLTHVSFQCLQGIEKGICPAAFIGACVQFSFSFCAHICSCRCCCYYCCCCGWNSCCGCCCCSCCRQVLYVQNCFFGASIKQRAYF